MLINENNPINPELQDDQTEPLHVVVDHTGKTSDLSAIKDWRGETLAILRYTHIKEQVRTRRYN